jgi:hypothetical protein
MLNYLRSDRKMHINLPLRIDEAPYLEELKFWKVLNYDSIFPENLVRHIQNEPK